MPGSNQFKAFATGGSANTLTPTAYAALTTLIANGFQSGVASSQQINTVFRQSTFVATAIAQAIADMMGSAVADDGVVANFENQLLAMLQSTPYSIPTVGGTVNAITGTFSPVIATRTNGMKVLVRATGANTTTTPTFAADATAAATIVKGAGAALLVGDIAGAGHWLELQWDATLAKWVLLNPALGVSSAGITLGTAQATTAGTAIDFTGIPSTAKRVTLMFNGVSTNGSSPPQIQLGSGSVQTTGYSGIGLGVAHASTPGLTQDSSGFQVGDTAGTFAATTRYGALTFTNMGSNTWNCVGMVAKGDTTQLHIAVGGVTLAGAIDRLRLTTINGTDTFDAGSVNISWE